MHNEREATELAKKAITENRKIAERYDILKLINTGGTSFVYLASDKNLNKSWAIKQVRKDNEFILQSLIKEAKILKDLDHPCLPRVTDVINDKNDKYFYIIMDYVEGESLRRLLKANGVFNEKEVQNIGMKLCETLTYLHGKEIIYRDMKPANVMLTPSGEIKLIDFGIARKYKASKKEDTTALGTEGYAAPEQYEGKGAQSDARTDVYCLGVTLFQLLTGQNPSTAKSNRFDIAEYDPYLSNGLRKVILKATEKNPSFRYRTAEEFRIALLNYEKLDDKYLEERKGIISGFRKRIIASIGFVLISAILFAANMFINASNYDNLINEGTQSSILKAINTDSKKPDGYIALLDTYETEFDEKEATEIKALFGSNKSNMAEKDILAIDMAIGEKYLTSYEDKSERSRIVYSYPFFKEIADSKNKDFEKYNAAVCYSNMGEFYKEYIMENSLIVNERTKKDYDSLFKGFDDMFKMLDKYDSPDKTNLALTNYELMLGIINQEQMSMKNANISKDTIEKILNKIESKTKELNPSHELTKEKKESLLSEIKTVRKSLKTTYFEIKK